MKKSLIMASAASLAMAAMPVMGAFAAGTNNTVTDEIIVTLPDTCSMTVTPGTNGTAKSYSSGSTTPDATLQYPTYDTATGAVTLPNYVVTYAATTIANGQAKEINATTIKVVCNNGSGWKVNAIGSSTEGAGSAGNTSTTTSMAPATNASKAIPSMTTGNTASGNNSWWGMKLTPAADPGGGAEYYATTVVSEFLNYHAIPATSTKVASGPITDTSINVTSGTTGTIEGTGSSFTTGYQVYVGELQEADTYTGKVTYTLINPNS